MKYSSAHQFIHAARHAPHAHKRAWIKVVVRNKEVLDLGVVAHTLDNCLRHRDQWLHALIKDESASVVGVDILAAEAKELQRMGYDVVVGDATRIRLDRKFDVVVCGDLVEHVSDTGGLLETIAFHLRDDGIALITTPNPFAVTRFFNVLADGWTDINAEHVSWICPQTMFQLAERSPLFIEDICWLETDFPMPTRRRYWGGLLNALAPRITKRRPLMHNDYGVLLRKRTPLGGQALPFVSVVVPTFNRARALEDALLSLAVQDYPPEKFEVIVVDNASADETRQLVARVAAENRERLTLKYVPEERRGLVFARHTGAARAAGEILLFTDDDAILDPNWISAVAKVYCLYPGVGAVGTRIAIKWDREPEAWVRPQEPVLGKLDYGTEILVQPGLYINGGSFSIRKAVLASVGGFNPGQRGPYIVGDSETGLCRKLAAKGVPIGWTPETTMWHVQQAGVNGTMADLKRRFRNNGICEAYHATFHGWPVTRVIRASCSKTWQLLRKILGAVFRLDFARFSQEIVLDAASLASYAAYLWNYRFDRRIRHEVRARDWEFGPDYLAPEIEPLGGPPAVRGPDSNRETGRGDASGTGRIQSSASQRDNAPKPAL